MNSVVFYQPPTSINGHQGRSTAPRNLLSSALYKRFPSNSARNHSMDDVTRDLDREVVLSYSDGPRRGPFQPSISATSQSLGDLDRLADSDDELPSVTDCLSHARPVASRVAPEVIDLTVESSHHALYPASPPLQTPPARDLPNPSVERSSLPATHDAPVATLPPRKSPFKNRPPWAIRKATPDSPQPAVELLLQPTTPEDGPALNRTNKLGVPPSAVPATAVCRTPKNGIVAPSDQHGASTNHTKDPWHTAIAHSASPEIADSDDGRADDDGADKRPRPFVFDVFAEDDDERVNDGQPPAKRRRRASSAALSVRPGEAWTPSVGEAPHDIGLYADLSREEEMLDDHEWQA